MLADHDVHRDISLHVGHEGSASHSFDSYIFCMSHLCLSHILSTSEHVKACFEMSSHTIYRLLLLVDSKHRL